MLKYKNEMRNDIAELKADVAELKADVAELKADFAELQVDRSHAKELVRLELDMKNCEVADSIRTLLGP